MAPISFVFRLWGKVRGKLLADAAIDTSLVSHQGAFLGYVGANDRHDGADAGDIDVEGASAATTLDQRDTVFL